MGFDLFNLSNEALRAGEMAQSLRTLILTEDPSLILALTWWLTTAHNQGAQDTDYNQTKHSNT